MSARYVMAKVSVNGHPQWPSGISQLVFARNVSFQQPVVVANEEALEKKKTFRAFAKARASPPSPSPPPPFALAERSVCAVAS